MLSSTIPVLALLAFSLPSLAQDTTPADAGSAATSTLLADSDPVGTDFPDLGVFQLISPTTHASNIPRTAYNKFESDALSFFDSYTSADTFTPVSAIASALQSAPVSARISLARLVGSLGVQVAAEGTGLLSTPTQHLKALASSAAPFGASVSNPIMSQASAILLGYESIASKDVLSVTPTGAKITPGASVGGSQPGSTGSAAAAGGSGSATGSAGSAGASSTSSGAAGAMVTANAQLIFNAAAAAVGMAGVALL